MKWILRILYGFLVVLIGMFVINSANATKRMNYLEDNAQSYYEDNNMENFVEEFYVAAGINKFVKKPIYKATSSGQKYNFDFSIYNARVYDKDKHIDVISFMLHNIDFNHDPINTDNYENNNNLMRVKVNVDFENYSRYIIYNLNGQTIPYNVNKPMDVFIPLEVVLQDNNAGNTFFVMGDQLTAGIKEISIDLIDGTAEGKDVLPTTTKIASFISNVNAPAFIETELLTKELVPSEDGEDIEIMKSTNFDGRARIFKQDEKYDNDDLGIISTVDSSKLKPYNKIVTIHASFYALGVTIVTFLLFFLKPLITHYRNKKEGKTI